MASRFKNRPRKTHAPAADKIPLVSVVIPMFNSAKFIEQTLESLLYQTMQNFEVVVVDDGSTDNSVEVVESFSERFGGRLHVIRLPENTGAPGVPRNVGIQFARGKYIAFLDSDDLFTKTALEELTTLAEEYQADVLHTNAVFNLWGGQPKSPDDPAMTDMSVLTNVNNCTIWQPQPFKLTEPVFESEDTGERVRKWFTSPPTAFWAMCFLFCRRDFLIVNQILFPPMQNGEDMLFAFEALCLAKTYINVPNAVYIMRPRVGSISRERAGTEDNFLKNVNVVKDGFTAFEKLTNKIKFLKDHIDYKYAAFDYFFLCALRNLENFYAQNPPCLLNELVKQKIQSDSPALAAYLFNALNVHRLQVMRLQQENFALKDELRKYQSVQ